jgi:hypothetical protein
MQEDVRGAGDIVMLFLSSALDRYGQFHVPAAAPTAKDPGTYWKGGLVGIRAVLDAME